MKQIYLDLRSSLEVDSFRNLIVCIDQFSKWAEVNPINYKNVLVVGQFLYELIFVMGVSEPKFKVKVINSQTHFQRIYML